MALKAISAPGDTGLPVRLEYFTQPGPA